MLVCNHHSDPLRILALVWTCIKYIQRFIEIFCSYSHLVNKKKNNTYCKGVNLFIPFYKKSSLWGNRSHFKNKLKFPSNSPKYFLCSYMYMYFKGHEYTLLLRHQLFEYSACQLIIIKQLPVHDIRPSSNSICMMHHHF